MLIAALLSQPWVVEILLSVIVIELAIIIIGFSYDDTPELSEEMRKKLYS